MCLGRANTKIRKLRRDLEDQWKHARLSSACTELQRDLTSQGEGWHWRWFAGSCPCCKRPVDVTVFRHHPDADVLEEPLRWQDSDDEEVAEIGTACMDTLSSRATNPFSPIAADDKIVQAPEVTQASADGNTITHNAYIVTLWGSAPGYVLGAMVLGQRLLELGTCADLLLLHTDDVPPNYLGQLASIWKLQEVDYIDGVDTLFMSRGTAISNFDGVFTKLNAFNQTKYGKAIMLDIDMIPLHPLDDLFELDAPAAMARGTDETYEHGKPIDGNSFFLGEEGEWPWYSGTGINAGVMLITPCARTFSQMLREVKAEFHPEHVRSAGPEQDYLSRFFAFTPWHHISVAYNFQLHHLSYSLRRTLFHRNVEASCWYVPTDWDRWCPVRLSMPIEHIRNIHFSGNLKLWQRVLENGTYETDADFAERLLEATFKDYRLWFHWEGSAEEFAANGCKVPQNGRIYCLDGDIETTPIVQAAVERSRHIACVAVAVWRTSYEHLLASRAGLLECLAEAHLPCGAPWKLGTELDVKWGERWVPCVVHGVHTSGDYIIKWKMSGEGADIERNVSAERLRLRERGNCLYEVVN